MSQVGKIAVIDRDDPRMKTTTTTARTPAHSEL